MAPAQYLVLFKHMDIFSNLRTPQKSSLDINKKVK